MSVTVYQTRGVSYHPRTSAFTASHGRFGPPRDTSLFSATRQLERRQTSYDRWKEKEARHERWNEDRYRVAAIRARRLAKLEKEYQRRLWDKQVAKNGPEWLRMARRVACRIQAVGRGALVRKRLREDRRLRLEDTCARVLQTHTRSFLARRIVRFKMEAERAKRKAQKRKAQLLLASSRRRPLSGNTTTAMGSTANATAPATATATAASTRPKSAAAATTRPTATAIAAAASAAKRATNNRQPRPPLTARQQRPQSTQSAQSGSLSARRWTRDDDDDDDNATGRSKSSHHHHRNNQRPFAVPWRPGGKVVRRKGDGSRGDGLSSGDDDSEGGRGGGRSSVFQKLPKRPATAAAASRSRRPPTGGGAGGGAGGDGSEGRPETANATRSTPTYGDEQLRAWAEKRQRQREHAEVRRRALELEMCGLAGDEALTVARQEVADEVAEAMRDEEGAILAKLMQEQRRLVRDAASVQPPWRMLYQAPPPEEGEEDGGGGVAGGDPHDPNAPLLPQWENQQPEPWETPAPPEDEALFTDIEGQLDEVKRRTAAAMGEGADGDEDGAKGAGGKTKKKAKKVVKKGAKKAKGKTKAKGGSGSGSGSGSGKTAATKAAETEASKEAGAKRPRPPSEGHAASHRPKHKHHRHRKGHIGGGTRKAKGGSKGPTSPTAATEKKDDYDEQGGSSSSFTVGQRVKARFAGRGHFYPGRIEAVNADGTFAVAYADGDEEDSVAAEFIQAIPTTPSAGAGGEGGGEGGAAGSGRPKPSDGGAGPAKGKSKAKAKGKGGAGGGGGKAKKDDGDGDGEDEDGWSCPACAFMNDNSVGTCMLCQTPRYGEVGATAGGSGGGGSGADDKGGGGDDDGYDDDDFEDDDFEEESEEDGADSQAAKARPAVIHTAAGAGMDAVLASRRSAAGGTGTGGSGSTGGGDGGDDGGSGRRDSFTSATGGAPPTPEELKKEVMSQLAQELKQEDAARSERRASISTEMREQLLAELEAEKASASGSGGSPKDAAGGGKDGAGDFAEEGFEGLLSLKGVTRGVVTTAVHGAHLHDEAVRRAFSLLDKNHNGLVNKSEILRAVRAGDFELRSVLQSSPALKGLLRPRAFAKAFAQLDPGGGDKGITLEAFAQFAAQLAPPAAVAHDDVAELFQLLDRDGNGYVEKGEIHKALRGDDDHNGRVTVDELRKFVALAKADSTAKINEAVQRAFSLLDKNHNGLVNKSEILRAVRAGDFELRSVLQSSLALKGLLRPRAFAKAFAQLDPGGGDKGITLEAFAQFAAQLAPPAAVAHDDVAELFQLLDRDGNGYVEKGEIHKALRGDDVVVRRDDDDDDDDSYSSSSWETEE
eukprot:g2333.t1